jgi:NTE family protein
VLRVLHDAHYYPEIIVGTSVGGYIGALLGTGHDQQWLENYFTSTSFTEMMQLGREGTGLISNERFREEFTSQFGSTDLRDLNPRVALIAADIRYRQQIMLTHGPIVTALLATTAVPGLFPGVRWGNTLLVDGGVSDNAPTQAAYMLGANRIVAVDLGGNDEPGIRQSRTNQAFSRYLERALYWLLDLSQRQVAFDTFSRALILSYDTLVQYQLAAYPPDILIRPYMPGIGVFSMELIPLAIEAGEAAAKRSAHKLKRMNSLFYQRSRPVVTLPGLHILDPEP